MTVPGNRILITGATGYVGGSVLDHLIKSTEPSIQGLRFDLLVRGEDQAKRLREAYGDRVNLILWKGLKDVDFIVETAANYDIVLNTGSGFILSGSKAFVDGLARRVEAGRPTPWLLHISGCTNLADRPLTDEPHPEREWDDANGGAIYEHLKSEDEKAPYPQRTTEIGVLAAAEERGVQAVSINAPCIFGLGTGLFNQQGIVVPIVIRYVVRHGYGFKLNDTASFDWVHIADLADLFVLLVRAILERQDRGVGVIPSGKKGFIFPVSGHAPLCEIMQRGLDVAFEAGVLPREDTPQQKEIRTVGIKELADEVTAGVEQLAEQGWAGHKGQKGTVAKKNLGWKPKRLDDAWNQDFKDELIAFQEGRRDITMANCIGLN